MQSIDESNNTFVRQLERSSAARLSPVQFGSPDSRSPEFAAMLRQQCKELKNDPAEAGVLRFTEEAATQIARRAWRNGAI